MLRIWPMLKIILDRPGTTETQLGSDSVYPRSLLGQPDIKQYHLFGNRALIKTFVAANGGQKNKTKRTTKRDGRNMGIPRINFEARWAEKKTTFGPPEFNENHSEGNLNKSYWPKFGRVAENPSGDLGTP